MSALASLLGEVESHCDLRERLALVPVSAKMRGVYFKSIELVLERAGRLRPYCELFPVRKTSVLWYPLSDFLQQLAVGAALLFGPHRVHEGMHEIGRANARVFVDSMLGRLLVRVLSREPRSLLQQAIIGHRQGCNYSTWSLSLLDDRTACMEMSREYNYIDSYLLGAARGTFEAIERHVHVEAELQGPFQGRHMLRW